MNDTFIFVGFKIMQSLESIVNNRLITIQPALQVITNHEALFGFNEEIKNVRTVLIKRAILDAYEYYNKQFPIRG